MDLAYGTYLRCVVYSVFQKKLGLAKKASKKGSFQSAANSKRRTTKASKTSITLALYIPTNFSELIIVCYTTKSQLFLTVRSNKKSKKNKHQQPDGARYPKTKYNIPLFPSRKNFQWRKFVSLIGVFFIHSTLPAPDYNYYSVTPMSLFTNYSSSGGGCGGLVYVSSYVFRAAYIVLYIYEHACICVYVCVCVTHKKLTYIS